MAENNKDILSIKLNVYNRTLPVNCRRDEEEKYRKSAKLITDLVNFYSSRYAGQKNDVDILYMVLINRKNATTLNRLWRPLKGLPMKLKMLWVLNQRLFKLFPF